MQMPMPQRGARASPSIENRQGSPDNITAAATLVPADTCIGLPFTVRDTCTSAKNFPPTSLHHSGRFIADSCDHSLILLLRTILYISNLSILAHLRSGPPCRETLQETASPGMAVLLGALQFRAMHQELVGSGKMTDRQFNDAILHENNMPIELLRVDLENLKLTRDFKTSWKFYGDHPTHP
jgi:hypothetical protein